MTVLPAFLHGLAGGFVEGMQAQLKTAFRAVVRDLRPIVLRYAIGWTFLVAGAFWLTASLFFAFAEMAKFAQAGLLSSAVCLGMGFLIIKIGGRIASGSRRPALHPRAVSHRNHARSQAEFNGSSSYSGRIA